MAFLIALSLGAAKFLFEWAGYNKYFIYSGNTRRLQDIWWHFPLRVALFFLLLVTFLPRQSDSNVETGWKNKGPGFSPGEDPGWTRARVKFIAFR